MRRSVTLRVDERALARLADLAQRERRRPADHAALLLETALGITDQPVTAERPVAEVGAA